MFASLARWIQSAFAPVFELLRDVPARAMPRLFSPL
jgi:hypothetical protein